ncbi:MAG: contractile injection system tape measure protein, partial [Balneolaceae bacterium]
LVSIWNYLSRSQKGIVLMVVSSSRIRGWEQLISQIERVAEQSAKITAAVELDKVFDLVFRHGVLRDADMESLLSLYLEELARQNRSTKKKILEELEYSDQLDQDRQLLSYLKIQPDAEQEYKSDRPQTSHDYKKTPRDRLLVRIDALFRASERKSSISVLQLFNSLDELEMRLASVYISSKKGWERLAGGLSAEEWLEMIAVAVSGELYDQALAIYDLLNRIHQAVPSGKTAPERRQLLGGTMLTVLMHHAADMNGRQLMRELLRREEIVNRTNVKPEAIKQIQASLTSTQTPYFNQWLAWWRDSDVDFNSGQTDSKSYESGDVSRVLNLLKKLTSATPDFSDRLLFPLLLRLLESREEAIVREVFSAIRDTSAVKKWSGNLPVAVLNELTETLLPDSHLKKAKKTLQELRTIVEDFILLNSKHWVESEILFRYAAVHRYRSYSENEFVKHVLFALADELPASNRADKIKELSVRVAEKLKERGGSKIKSIEKILKSLDAEAAKTPSEMTDSEPSQINEYNQLKKAFDLDEQHFDGEAIYINRAGLILAAPFFPTLFERLGYLNEKDFSDERTRARAIHVMEYLATGRIDVEEYQLVLQKLLAGLPPQTPVDPIESLTDEEIEMSDSMLNGLISNWPGLGNTTIEGLREAFFQREGRLQKADDHWALTVQAKAYDVLLDRVPWSIGMIKLPWMDKMLRVEWR